MITYDMLSSEQQEMVSLALKGINVLVDACIGSGKTTAIQVLCDMIKNKRVLYMTYNHLLMIDARSKISGNKMHEITNYHTYAGRRIHQANIKLKNGVSNIQYIIDNRDEFDLSGVDVLIIDEYQDIKEDTAELLRLIKESNRGIQIIAVGDMEQKIWDTTKLDVHSFIEDFLGDYEFVSFTKCFRLSHDLAEMLGSVWQKEIVGVNTDCKVEYKSFSETFEVLKDCECKNILCLGGKSGSLVNMLNKLEQSYPFKFNKNTVYATIRDKDNDKSGVNIKSNLAIFTTFDSSKGMERDVCCVFDFTEDYWNSRAIMPNVKYEILRNIFCVAASRGKKRIIFVKSDSELLDEKILSRSFDTNLSFEKAFSVSNMFQFKFKGDLDDCMKCLEIEELVEEDTFEIKVNLSDGLIDLSPCIGILQEVSYFKNESIDEMLIRSTEELRGGTFEFFAKEINKLLGDKVTDAFVLLQKKVLALAVCDTKQYRYYKQVKVPFVNKETLSVIHNRLATKLSMNENVQGKCCIKFDRGESFGSAHFIVGRYDVIADGMVWELKFVSELNQEHFLQCAMYLAMTEINEGILWNVRDNKRFKISVKNSKAFVHQVISTITKGALNGDYYKFEVMRQ